MSPPKQRRIGSCFGKGAAGVAHLFDIVIYYGESGNEADILEMIISTDPKMQVCK